MFQAPHFFDLSLFCLLSIWAAEEVPVGGEVGGEFEGCGEVGGVEVGGEVEFEGGDEVVGV